MTWPSAVATMTLLSATAGEDVRGGTFSAGNASCRRPQIRPLTYRKPAGLALSSLLTEILVILASPALVFRNVAVVATRPYRLARRTICWARRLKYVDGAIGSTVQIDSTP